MTHTAVRKPLKGHRYHELPDDSLLYIIRDAREAAEAMRGHDDRAEAKYLDQLNDACTVLGYRAALIYAKRYPPVP